MYTGMQGMGMGRVLKECTRVCRAWEWDVGYKECTCTLVCRAWELEIQPSIVSLYSTGRLPHFQSICSTGKQLQAEVQVASKAIGHRVSTLQERWKKLTDMMANRKSRLEEAAQSQQVRGWECVCGCSVCVDGG